MPVGSEFSYIGTSCLSIFCLSFSNLPHYTNPLNTRKKIEINKLLCPGNLNKTRGIYNIRFPYERDKKRKS